MIRNFIIKRINRNVNDNQFKKKEINILLINKNVKLIGKNAFLNNKIKKLNLKKIEIIEERAFKDNIISKLELSEELKTINRETFQNNNIEDINFKNVENIGDSAFRNNNIVYLNTANIKKIEKFAFYGNKIQKLDMNDKLEEIESFSFERNSLRIINFNNEIKIIPKSAFAFNYLENITIPDNIESIEDSAFRNNHIKYLNLSKNLKQIGPYSFYNNMIDKIKIPDQLKKLPKSVFACNNLKTIIIPKNIEIIGPYAFAENKIEEIIINEGCKKIDDYAFHKNNLKKIIIPETVDTIGYSVVENCEVYYKKQKFTVEEINKLGTHYLSKMVKIKEINNNFELLQITKEELNYLPIDKENLKGYMNNRKRFKKLATELGISEKVNFDILSGSDVKYEYLCLIKLAFTLGYFRLNGEKLNSLEKDIKKIYENSSNDDISKMVFDINSNKYNESFSNLIRTTINDPQKLQKMQHYYSYVYNNFDEIKKGILKKNNQKIAELNTEYKKYGSQAVKNKHDILRKNKKILTIDIIEEYIVNNLFELRFEELKEITAYVSGLVTSEQFKKIENIYFKSLQITNSYFKELKGDYKEYHYEWVNNQNSINLILGYLLHCCAKIDGAGEDIMIQSMINPKIKNLVVYDKFNKIIGKSTAFYNNDYILCNNIEVSESFTESSNTTKQAKIDLLNTFKKALIEQAQVLETVKQVGIGLKKNDLKDEIENDSLEIRKNNMLKNYNYKSYSGDANDPAYGQAIIYKK